jgi:hypothetical protein
MRKLKSLNNCLGRQAAQLIRWAQAIFICSSNPVTLKKCRGRRFIPARNSTRFLPATRQDSGRARWLWSTSLSSTRRARLKTHRAQNWWPGRQRISIRPHTPGNNRPSRISSCHMLIMTDYYFASLSRSARANAFARSRASSLVRMSGRSRRARMSSK